MEGEPMPMSQAYAVIACPVHGGSPSLAHFHRTVPWSSLLSTTMGTTTTTKPIQRTQIAARPKWTRTMTRPVLKRIIAVVSFDLLLSPTKLRSGSRWRALSCSVWLNASVSQLASHSLQVCTSRARRLPLFDPRRMIGMYVGAIPGECASSGWPDEWIEEFEEDPEKVMDEKETAIFYNWREWEV